MQTPFPTVTRRSAVRFDAEQSRRVGRADIVGADDGCPRRPEYVRVVQERIRSRGSTGKGRGQLRTAAFVARQSRHRSRGSRGRVAATLTMSLIVALASACAQVPSSRRASGEASAPRTSRIRAREYDPGRFDENSDDVDNPWFPLVPGTRFVWDGRAFNDDGEPVARRVVFIVTDLTKVIDGVNTVVGWDRDYDDGSLDESELVFYAQDTEGNVWHLGELVEHWEHKELRGIRTWFVDSPQGARAGVQMPAEPVLGTHYSQGFAPPPWFWDDRARISDVGIRTCVPVGCFPDSIITEEFEPRFPGDVQLKYYAPGVGGVRVGWTGDDEEREVMVLTAFEQLSAAGLAQVRTTVQAQENRAYAYAQTEPSSRRTDVP
jgi:hypothetical protein